ncbi:MAG: polyprenyl synthetase family protein, partial [Verrucomicrobiota bacterium]|nr:polyprenyl synthetase family protein [Verrucomicrobiota bacterium]
MTSALSRLEWRLRASFCNDPILAKLSDDDYFWSGQNIRGKICLDLGYAYNIPEDILLDIAASTQLLHDASLIHDDLIDEDSERRGVLTIWKKYGKAKALLLGDLLIAKAYEIVGISKADPTLKVSWINEISCAIRSAVSGASLELDFNNSAEALILKNYYSMASLKTGALFALPARCIALFAQQKIHTAYLHKILLNMAVAYQIKDDQSDFSCIKTGRKLSSDLKNGRPNLYNLYAEYNMSSAEIFTQIQDYHDNLVAQS